MNSFSPARCVNNVGYLPRVGLLGLGRQGAEHLRACLDLARKNQLVIGGICDSNSRRQQEVASTFGLPAFPDHKTMFGAGQLDAVIVAVPNHLHVEMTVDALRSGLHVLKEKPFALSMNEARELGGLASRRGLKLRVAQQRGFHPHYQTARSWSQNLGRIRFIDYAFCLNDTTFSWYWNKATGGGCWHGLGWHGSWIFNFFDVNPVEVSLRQMVGKQRATTLETDDTCFLSSLSSEGTFGRMFLSVVHPEKKEELFIDADGGSIRLHRNGVELFDPQGVRVAENSTRDLWNAAYESQIESFLADLDSSPTPTDPADWNTMVLHSAALSSAEAGGSSFAITQRVTPQVLSEVPALLTSTR